MFGRRAESVARNGSARGVLKSEDSIRFVAMRHFLLKERRYSWLQARGVAAGGQVPGCSRPCPAPRSLAGFTIAEVVIAIAICAIGAAALMSCFGYAIRLVGQFRANQRATQIIMEKAETLRLYSWDQVNTSGFIPASFTNTYDGDFVTTNYSGTVYYGVVTVGNFPDSTSYAGRMKQLTLTLNWTTENIFHTRSLTTFIAQDGIQNYVY